jgi:hypothetical protein
MRLRLGRTRAIQTSHNHRQWRRDRKGRQSLDSLALDLIEEAFIQLRHIEERRKSWSGSWFANLPPTLAGHACGA